MNQKLMLKKISILILATLSSGCLFRRPPPPGERPVNAISFLKPTKGNSTEGKINIHDEKGMLKFTGILTGLTPGKHGLHIHEFGDCSAEDASSAGSHFNPKNEKHSSPEDHEKHMGDLGNIYADDFGKSTIDIEIKKIPLHKILGRSILVHEKEDDFISQPAGNSGPKLACGVIGVVK